MTYNQSNNGVRYIQMGANGAYTTHASQPVTQNVVVGGHSPTTQYYSPTPQPQVGGALGYMQSILNSPPMSPSHSPPMSPSHSPQQQTFQVIEALPEQQEDGSRGYSTNYDRYSAGTRYNPQYGSSYSTPSYTSYRPTSNYSAYSKPTYSSYNPSSYSPSSYNKYSSGSSGYSSYNKPSTSSYNSHTTQAYSKPSTSTHSYGSYNKPSSYSQPTQVVPQVQQPVAHPSTPEYNYPKGKTRSLFVGINYPGTSAQLAGCVNDVTIMLKLLPHRWGLDVSDRRILVDEPGYPGNYGQPSKANILEGLRWLVSGAQPGDVLFWHYSGHGTPVKDKGNDEDDGSDEALVPGDYERAGMIIDDEIYAVALQNLPKGVRFTAVTDCCHSGTIMDLPFQYTWDGANFGRPKKRNDRQRGFRIESKKRSDADVIQFSGCKDVQTSADTHTTKFDNPYDGPGFAGGACTNAIVEMFNKYENLSYGQMIVGMREILKRKRYTQVPQLSTTFKVDMNSKFDVNGGFTSHVRKV